MINILSYLIQFFQKKNKIEEKTANTEEKTQLRTAMQQQVINEVYDLKQKSSIDLTKSDHEVSSALAALLNEDVIKEESAKAQSLQDQLKSSLTDVEINNALAVEEAADKDLQDQLTELSTDVDTSDVYNPEEQPEDKEDESTSNNKENNVYIPETKDLQDQLTALSTDVDTSDIYNPEEQPEDKEDESTSNDEENNVYIPETKESQEDDNYSYSSEIEFPELHLSDVFKEMFDKIKENPDYLESSEIESFEFAFPFSDEFKEIFDKITEEPDYLDASEIDDQHLFSMPSGQCEDLDTCS